MSQLVDAYEKLSDRTSVQPPENRRFISENPKLRPENNHPDCCCAEINHFGYTKIPRRCQDKNAPLV